MNKLGIESNYNQVLRSSIFGAISLYLLFSLNDCHKKYILRKLRKLWRDHRSNLVTMVMKQAQVVGLPRAASLLKPDNKSKTPNAISRTDVWIYGYEKRKRNED
ncbi:unnamed protein product, partial [Prunus brigantina]